MIERKKLSRSIKIKENNILPNLSELQERNDGFHNKTRSNSISIDSGRIINHINEALDYEHNFLSKFLKAYSAGQKELKQYITKREQSILDLAKFKQDLDNMSGDENYDKKNSWKVKTLIVLFLLWLKFQCILNVKKL